MKRTDKTIIATLTASLLLFPTVPGMDWRDESPAEVIRARNQAVTRILETSGDEPNEETRERLKEVINSVMDFKELSRRSLGKYWNERTEQEKKAFIEVFEQLIRNSSVKKLSVYRADSMTYDEPAVTGGEATVRTIAYKDRKSVEIVYEMHIVGGEWKAYDLVIDGASTIRTYRDSFYRQLAKSTYTEMYDKLVRKLSEER